MGEAEQTYDQRIRDIVDSFLKYCNEEVECELTENRILHEKAAEILYRLDGPASFRHMLSHVEEELRSEKGITDPSYILNTQIYVDHAKDMVDAWIAKVRLKMQHCRENHMLFFKNSLASHGMRPEDLENVVADYHDSVAAFTKISKQHPCFKHTESEPEFYEDQARAFKHQLDLMASEFFGLKIRSRLAVDAEEKRTHFTNGKSTIGKCDYEHELWSDIAHEASFGHQAQKELTEMLKYGPNYPEFRHTSEGLAMLGQQLALERVFNGNDFDFAAYDIAKMMVYVAFNAAVEKLLYFDKRSSEEISEMLASSQYTQKEIKSMLAAFDSDELRIPQGKFPVAIPYYVGYNKVKKAYDIAMRRVKGSGLEEKLPRIMSRMYAGYRRPETMEREVNAYIDALQSQ
ncbi:hypothetical protein KY311_03945 [Candidatus Woesearchaeota archaeon]|nr:hypothetical protein [Candidatus Woesearchaeota archaeon]